MKSLALLLMLSFHAIFGQISGKITDASDKKPIPYVNVWVKNTLIGSTTNEKGLFYIDRAKIGDTIYISCMGYATTEFIAKKKNIISLHPQPNKLEEVVVTPMKNTKNYIINSFKKVKKNRNWYNNSHYSLARFYPYKEIYKPTPFVEQIDFITNNYKKETVILTLRLLKSNDDGSPSNQELTDKIMVKAPKGVQKITVTLKDKKILFPKNGFFVVIDRLNLQQNLHYNKIAKMNILQPAIGAERKPQDKNTWLGYTGLWVSPDNLKKVAGNNENIAVNIKLTN